MLTSFGWSLTVHSVFVSLRTLLLDGSNVESLRTGAIDCARVSGSLRDVESLSLPHSIPFAPSSRKPLCTVIKQSVCCSCCGLLFLGSFLRFCFFLGDSAFSSGSLYVSATANVCASLWLVTSPMGRRAALRAAKALTAGSAIRTKSFLRIGA